MVGTGTLAQARYVTVTDLTLSNEHVHYSFSNPQITQICKTICVICGFFFYNANGGSKPVPIPLELQEKMMTIVSHPRFAGLCVVVLLILTSASAVLAQHDSGGVTGGGMIGGSTGRPTTKPTTPRPATTTKPPVRKPTPGRRPTTTSTTSSADSYYQQAEALYSAKKYRE